MRKRIYIGNQTAFSANTPTEPFEYAVANGFDAFEWFPDKKNGGAGWDENDLDLKMRAQIRETAAARGMRLSVHARWQANPLQDSEALLTDIELARDLGASLVNIHLFSEAGIAAFTHAILPLADRIGDAGLQLAIENTVINSPREFNEFFAQLFARDTIPLRHVGMCFDLGHANLYAGTRNDYLAYLGQLSADVPIIHLHLHENWGDCDSHLPLFAGPAGSDPRGVEEFARRILQRNFSGSIILEQWPHPPSLLNIARQKIKQLFAEAPIRHESRNAPVL